MKGIITLVSLAVATSVSSGDLRVVAEHSGGGFSVGVQWRIDLAGERVQVFAPDAARNGTFAITEEQRQQLISLLGETRFFDLSERYGMGYLEGNSCRMAISLGAQKRTVTLLMYSKSKPPSEAEALEVQRAYRVWDALKALGRLADLPDDCRRDFEIWDVKPKYVQVR